MNKLIELIKPFIEIFAKQISLNVLVITCGVTAGIIYYHSNNKNALYTMVGTSVFFCANEFMKKWKENHSIERKFSKMLKKRKYRDRIIKQLDVYDKKLLSELYNAYPNKKEYDIKYPPILKLNGMCMLIQGDFYIPDGLGTLNNHYTLQPWIKNLIDTDPSILK